MIFDIQRFSTHDGEGIRTTVFFKGCPLRCPWCENPESQSFRAELFYDPRPCLRCGDCTRVRPEDGIDLRPGGLHIDRHRIRDPEEYREVCPSGALRVVGQALSVEQILQEIRKDLSFYRRSGGGVTLSGGEPFGQPRLALELLRALKALGVPTAVETSLQAPWPHIAPCLFYVDTFLADLKHTDAGKLEAATGAEPALIEGNFRNLERNRAPVVVRVPVIPGFNDRPEEIEAIVQFAASLTNVREIHFLPFHTLGVGKYALIDKEYRFLSRAPEGNGGTAALVRLAEDKGLTAVIGG
jgi:pyruvate formate lyase activating enzyme